MDYSSSYYIPVSNGKVAVFQNFEALAHVTNLTDFIAITSETEKLMGLYLPSLSRQLLEADLQEIRKSVNSLRIHHRYARSINFIGSALKYVAGTPDYDDFKQIQDKQDELISASNNQILVNTEIQQQINNLTQTVNFLLNKTKTSEINGGHLFDLLSSRNRAIIRELDSISLSIVLGKNKIINPILLDSKEVNFILKIENLSISVNEIIANSNLKILQNEDIITFLIKFPDIKYLCDKKQIFPVIHSNKILSFETDTVAKCNNNYIMLNKCVKETTISFCKPMSNVNNSCLFSLLNTNTASCNTIPAHSMPKVSVVDDGIAIINDASANISYQGEQKNLQKGTFMITFEQDLTINSTKFKNLRKLAFMSPEIPMAHSINFSDHIALLSLPYLHDLNINNSNHISHLHYKIQGCLYTSASLFALFLVSAALFLYLKWQRKMQITNIVRRMEQTGTSDA